MKKKMIIATLLLLPGFVSKAQEKTTISLPATKVKVVVIETSAKTNLKSTSSGYVVVNSTLNQKGKVRGLSWPSNRPEFDILRRTSGDTLYIKTPERFSPAIVGVSTYSEEILNTIDIPTGIAVVVKKSEELHFENYFAWVQVQNGLLVTGSDLPKNDIGQLLCNAGAMLKVNERKDLQVYEFNGTGHLFIHLNADEIILNLK